MYMGSQKRKVYETSFVKKRHSEKSITPGIRNAPIKPMASSVDGGCPWLLFAESRAACSN